MHVAGLGSPQQSQWLTLFCGKLLLNSKDTFALLSSAPPTRPPKYIRATQTEYTFANSTTNPDHWWRRKPRTRKPFLDMMTLSDQRTVELLTGMGTNMTLDRSVSVACYTSLFCMDQRPEVVASLVAGTIVLVLVSHFLGNKEPKVTTIRPSQLHSMNSATQTEPELEKDPSDNEEPKEQAQKPKPSRS